MFPDIGGSELIIVAIVALLVVKPKDLPMMMRKAGEFMAKARRMANDFRASFEDMARQSELDDLRKEVEAMRSKASDPMGLTTIMKDTGAEIRAGLETPTEPDYAFNYAGDEVDNSIPWTETSAEPFTEVAPQPAAATNVAPRKKKPAAKAPVETAAAVKKAAPKKTVKAPKAASATDVVVKPAKRAAAKPSIKRAK